MKERNEIFNTKVINLFLRKILTKKNWKILVSFGKKRIWKYEFITS